MIFSLNKTGLIFGVSKFYIEIPFILLHIEKYSVAWKPETISFSLEVEQFVTCHNDGVI